MFVYSILKNSLYFQHNWLYLFLVGMLINFVQFNKKKQETYLHTIQFFEKKKKREKLVHTEF